MPAPASQPGFGPNPWDRWCARRCDPPTPPPPPPPCDFYAVVPPLPYSDYLKRENLQLAPPPKPALRPPPTPPAWDQVQQPSGAATAFDPSKKSRHWLAAGAPVESPRWKARLEYVYTRRVVNHLGRLVDVLF